MLIMTSCCCQPPGPAYQASQGPTELLLWDPARAFGGYTLFGVGGTTYLVDMSGSVVHTWKVGTNPKLLPNGHVLDAAKDDPSGFGGFPRTRLGRNVVWQSPRRARTTRRTTTSCASTTRSSTPTPRCTSPTSPSPTRRPCRGLRPAMAPKDADKAQVDAVVEVDASGTVVWEWWFWTTSCRTNNATCRLRGRRQTVADAPGRLDVTSPGARFARTGCTATRWTTTRSWTGRCHGVGGRVLRDRPRRTFVAGAASSG